jgi:xanthine dehydrogenase molybdenum-binding subunit
MLEYKPNIVLSEKEYEVVGKRPIRPDGVAKVTGRATYGADIRLPGLLYGKILRSPYSHARIKFIDTRHAEELPGVYATMTSADLAQPSGRLVDLGEGVQHNMRFLSNNLMAADKVLYKGHAVAAVAATSSHLAEEALALIQVEYEELPPVLTAEDAMKLGAPLLHERLASLTNINIRPGGLLSDDDPTPGSNLANRIEFRLGDIDQGFQDADVIVEHETFTCPIHQGYIEPHTGTALWNNDGTLTIWSSSQGHFNVRDQTARLLNVPVSMVRAIPMEIGGGFGGKTIVYVEPVAAVLARKAGRPVKVTMARTEVFEATGPTSGTHVSVKLGATKDGRLVAGEAHLIYEAGAFPGSPMPSACQGMMGPYDIPNIWIEGFDVVVNKPKSAAYRAPGVPAAAFAMETAMDILCEKLGMDPMELRLLNSAKEGTRASHGPVWPRIGFVEVLQAAKDHPHYATPLTGPYRGRGVGSGLWRNNTGPSSAIAVVHNDGRVHLTEGSPDIGGTRASIAQQFAETPGYPLRGDPSGSGAHGCRGLYVSHRGQWRDLQDGLGRVSCRPGDQTPDVRARRQNLERAGRAGDVCGRHGVGHYGPRTLSHLQTDCGPPGRHGRSHRRALRGQPARCGGVDGHPYCGRGGGPGDRKNQNPAVYRGAGRRQSHPSQLCGGTNPGRHGARYRLGPQRRVCLQCEGPHAQCEFPRLSHARLPGPAHARYGDRGSA